MKILKNELDARYQLTKLLVSTGYVNPSTDVLEDEFKQEDGVLNQGDDVTVDELYVSRQAVKDETDINIDRFNSDEDEVHIKDEIPVR